MHTTSARNRSFVQTALLATTLAASLTGCGSLTQLLGALNYAGTGNQTMQPPRPPTVRVSAVTLARSPDAKLLAAHFCTQLAPPPVCMLLGPLPTREQLQFHFNVDLTFRNENSIPLPAAEALAAFTAYPQANQHNLGALCVSLCESGTCPAPGPDACRSRSGDLRTIEDYTGAAVNFLVNLATGNTRLEDVRVRTIPPNGTATARLTLALDPEQTVRLVYRMSEGVLQQVQRGQVPVFELPYRFEGTVWVNVEHFGRIAAAIPAFEGTWRIEPPRNNGAPNNSPLGNFGLPGFASFVR